MRQHTPPPSTTPYAASMCRQNHLHPLPPALPLFFFSGLYHFGLFSEDLRLLTYVQIWLHVFTPLEDLNIEEINIYFFINGKTHSENYTVQKNISAALRVLMEKTYNLNDFQYCIRPKIIFTQFFFFRIIQFPKGIRCNYS
jgi:hypothetical protein